MTESELRSYRAEVLEEVRNNILAPWMKYSPDTRNGGFIGYADRQWRPDYDACKSSILITRILWTFSKAYRELGDPAYLGTATQAYHFLLDRFWDKDYGGLYWDITAAGPPLERKKQIYSQAFGIYALSEYYAATAEYHALQKALDLFELVHDKSRDAQRLGYIEACSRDWRRLQDMRLSTIDMNAPKSMNTHLHVLEAYTNLYKVSQRRDVAAALHEIIDVVMRYVVDENRSHFLLFFTDDWRSMSDHVSFGHDIEGSWLLREAAATLDDEMLLQQAVTVSLGMAEVVLREGVAADGS